MSTHSFRNQKPTIVRVTHAETGEEIAVGPERIRKVEEVDGRTLFTYHGPHVAGGAGKEGLFTIPIKESKANVNAQLANTSIYF